MSAITALPALAGRPAVQALRGIAGVPARVLEFAIHELAERNGLIRPTDLPSFALSRGILAQVALDEAILGVMKTPSRYPDETESRRVADELAVLAAHYERNEWTGNPVGYHQAPPTPDDVSRRMGWALGQRLERLSWRSGFQPHPDHPAGDRWTMRQRNKVARAALLVHPGGPRPWIVAIHGLGTGQAMADMVGLRIKHLHHELGYNIAMPVLPLHGRRSERPLEATEFLSHDLSLTTLAVSHAMWDIRSLIRFLRERRNPRSISLYGVSLGGFTASLLAGLEDDLERVVVGVPLVDIPTLFDLHAKAELRQLAQRTGLLGETATTAHSVISPLATPVRVPTERLAIFAGLGDRMTPAREAMRLWEHWGRPDLCLYPGNHVGFLWSKDVHQFLDEQFAR
ncbi:MAG: hypothetical protein R3249_02525 [Nitriliruptorales bacterium]|nr:hypothetical protein [Nitriliruptorales bacterium]